MLKYQGADGRIADNPEQLVRQQSTKRYMLMLVVG